MLDPLYTHDSHDTKYLYLPGSSSDCYDCRSTLDQGKAALNPRRFRCCNPCDAPDVERTSQILGQWRWPGYICSSAVPLAKASRGRSRSSPAGA